MATKDKFEQGVGWREYDKPKRWVKNRVSKKYPNGKDYYFNPAEHGLPATRTGSWRAARDWWEAKKAEIDGDGKPLSASLLYAQHLLRTLQERLAVYVKAGETEKADKTRQAIAFFERDIANPGNLDFFDDGSDSKYGHLANPWIAILEEFAFPVDRQKLRDSGIEFDNNASPQKLFNTVGDGRELQVLEKQQGTIEKTKKIGYHAEEFCAMLSAKAAAKIISGETYANNKRYIDRFATFVGTESNLSVLSKSETLQSYYVHLAGLLAAKTLSEEPCKRALKTAIRFINWLAEQDILETLPRNLNSKELLFKVPTKAVKTPEVSAIRKAFETATGQTRLHILLMANCGFTQIDIGCLKQSDVNWKEGRIRRKRSKTKEVEDVPIVDYKLWPETLALLKEYRSNDSEVALLTEDGRRWWIRDFVDGKVKKADNVEAAFRARKKATKKSGRLILIADFPMKTIRKKSASFLFGNRPYAKFTDYFLGHSPASMADKHYIDPDDAKPDFDKALDWLRGKYGFKAAAKKARPS